MLVTNIIFEDFTSYKKPNMLIGTTKCSFKCDKEAGTQVCQNSCLAAAKAIEIDDFSIIKKYINNPITKAVCIAGLEPFDTFWDMYCFICQFRKHSNDDIVIYTGYYPDEIKDYLIELKKFSNIIIKFGRFIPNDEPINDEVLGVRLASKNQYAKRLEDLFNNMEEHI